MSIAGGGSEHRTVYFFNTVDGIIVRARCFKGSLQEFRAKVLADVNGDVSSLKALQYLGFANIVAATWAPELIELTTLPAPAQPLTDEQKDAARYRWLKPRMMGADFDWNESGACALVFEWPRDVQIGADCDRNIDSAIEAAHGITKGD